MGHIEQRLIHTQNMKPFVALIALSVMFQSCSKTEDTVADSGNFVITGVRDVDLSVTSTGSYTYPISVTSTNGAKNTVRLAGDYMPGGVYADCRPSSGVTPFTSQVTISTDYTTGGGTFPLKIKGTDSIGSRSYGMNVTLSQYRGWQFGSDIFIKESVEKDPGTVSYYASIKATATNGSHLNISFAKGAGLPKANSTYKISGDTGKSNIQIALYDGAHIWSATGKRTDGMDAPTGVFTFDTLKRFTFKCSSVEMSDGVKKQALNCSFSE